MQRRWDVHRAVDGGSISLQGQEALTAERSGMKLFSESCGAVMRILLLIVCGCWLASTSRASALGPSHDYFEPKLLTGSIYDKEGGRLLFTFRRTATRTG